MDVAVALAELEALRSSLDEAGDALMTVAERGLTLTGQSPVDATAITDAFSEIMTLCAFQDLAGQRLKRLADEIAGTAFDTRPDAALLHGPANDSGLDQAAADALFDEQ